MLAPAFRNRCRLPFDCWLPPMPVSCRGLPGTSMGWGPDTCPEELSGMGPISTNSPPGAPEQGIQAYHGEDRTETIAPAGGLAASRTARGGSTYDTHH